MVKMRFRLSHKILYSGCGRFAILTSMDDPTIYCEGLTNLEHQPFNTISNAVFLISAYLSYKIIRQSGEKDWFVRLLPFLIAFIGLSSAFWHHYNNSIGDIADTLAIGIFALLVSIILIKRLTTKTSLQLAGLVLILVISLWLEQLPFFNSSLVYLFLFSVLGLIIYFLSKHGQAKLLPGVIAILLLTTGLISRIIDPSLCGHLPIGTHFIWHLLTALATYFIVLSLLETRRD